MKDIAKSAKDKGIKITTGHPLEDVARKVRFLATFLYFPSCCQFPELIKIVNAFSIEAIG